MMENYDWLVDVEIPPHGGKISEHAIRLMEFIGSKCTTVKYPVSGRGIASSVKNTIKRLDLDGQVHVVQRGNDVYLTRPAGVTPPKHRRTR